MDFLLTRGREGGKRTRNLSRRHMYTDPGAADIFDRGMVTVYGVEQRLQRKGSELSLEILLFGKLMAKQFTVAKVVNSNGAGGHFF